MKKIITSLAITVFTVTVIFLSCKKVENNTETGDDKFIAQAKSWFNTSFVNTTEYINGTADGNFKTPSWKFGKTYNIGKTQVAEFPLIAGRKKVYISETLSEADSRRVIDNTKFKVLFVKAPGKRMEVRIIQFTPTFNYLQSKNFNLSNLSFKDYTKEFKGDFMMFDFDNNFKRGYHFANDGIKIIKLKTKFPKKNNIKNPSGEGSSLISEDACDNISNPDLDPNCTYIAHITYSITCTGGWNPEEGFNPNYCRLVIESVFCVLRYCNPPGGGDPDLDACLNQGHTQEECNCNLYGVGCEGGGGGDPDEEQCATDLINLASSAAVSDETISITTVASDLTTRTKNYEWKILTSLGGWYIFSYDKGVHEKDPVNLANPWKWQSFDHDAITQVGVVIGGSVEPTLLTATPTVGLYNAAMEIKFKVKYSVICSISPINYTLTYTSSKLFNIND